MAKLPRGGKRKQADTPASKTSLIGPQQGTDQPALRTSFIEIVDLIEKARQQAYQAVNTTLIDLYWRVGEYISRKLETAAWGEGVVEQLAEYIAQRHPDIRGFNRPNLFRMR